MAEYVESVVLDKPLDGSSHLRIVALIDRAKWRLEPELRGRSVAALRLRVRDRAAPLSPQPGRTPKGPSVTWSDSLSVISPTKGCPPGCRALQDPSPAPYTLVLSAVRIDRHGRSEDVGEWSFSGQLKPGESFRFRTDAMLELMRDSDDEPYRFVLSIRLRSKRNVALENPITASTALRIGQSAYELVSKEILALYSDFFMAFYYGGFAESASNLNALNPLHNENVQDFETAMAQLLVLVHCRCTARVTLQNASLLFSVIERYQFAESLDKRIDDHIVRLCVASKNYRDWDRALLIGEQYGSTEIVRRVIPLYASAHELALLADRLQGGLTAPTLHAIFKAYRNKSLEAHHKRICHIWFDLVVGKAIVQLNRIGLPRLTSAFLDQFSGLNYAWDHKNRLVSVDRAPYTLWDIAEAAGKHTVPDEAWALIMRFTKNGGNRFLLTKTRPEGIYLGFVVTGEEHLNRRERCDGTGRQYIEI